MGYANGCTLIAIEVVFVPRGAFILGVCDLHADEVVVGGLGISVALAFEKLSGCLEFELDWYRGPGTLCCG